VEGLTEYEPVIGLEIHTQLNCATKMFCDCPNEPGAPPNRNTCPICLWLPGAMARLSEEALENAVLTCLALNCEVQPESAFDQKVYYYPDLPKGFQLSQFHRPLARNGWLDVPGSDGESRRLRIREVHMEEDVAKLVHEVEGRTPISLVDFNRAGVPLVEIVTEPDMRSPQDAMDFLRALIAQIRYVGSAECSMERGTLRADANVSLRPKGSDGFATKVEVKNMNSIRHVGDAIAHEIRRQTERLGAGEQIVLHTRLWDPVRSITTPMRAKFSGPCVPDPSVPLVVLSERWIEEMRGRLPEMPDRKRQRLARDYGLTDDEASLMAGDRGVADYFETAAEACGSPRAAAQWMANQLLPALRAREEEVGAGAVPAERFAGLIRLIEAGAVTANAAREVLQLMFAEDGSPGEIVDRHGLRQVTDTGELEAVVDQVIAANGGAVRDYRDGKTQAIGFLVGQAMRVSKGKANPGRVRELLESKLS
jgi:aspartyl-tRNA(Asn)/glutamyl-tRNA(Gln) amidotransferase subunit B